MITYDALSKSFHLASDNTSYVIQIAKTGHLFHLYYGEKLERISVDSLTPKFGVEIGGQVLIDPEDRSFNLNTAFLEIGTFGKGDFRDPSFHFRLPDGSRITDFTYVKHEITTGKPSFPNQPETFGNKEDVETLKVTLADKVANLEIALYYSIFPSIDIIARRAVVNNISDSSVTIEKAMSFSFDMLSENYECISLDGAWIRERQIKTHSLDSGIFKIDSKKGVSSSDHNPFFAIMEAHTDESFGKCYGFSLIYSGNFEASMEVSPHNLLRVMMGINSFDFHWELKKGETFVTPEALLTYSGSGLTKLSENLHELANHHIIKPDWQGKARPVLLNNWEATMFDFTERKILKLAKEAKKLGAELFVLDDGWFGKRNDDKSSLGDWTPNLKKLPSGITGLAKKIHKIGLEFGIWVEPEMVNPDSDLYRQHPDWAIKHPKREPGLGRNQLILDLVNPEVREYLYDCLEKLFSSANITYCKWDMNRNFSDVYSMYLPKEEQGSYFHRYTLALYELLERLTKEFPDILFEGCASGGNRFDFGILYYMPQIWTSDDTDAYERAKIQYGTSMAYPSSTMSAHVSNVPNLQTMRQTSLETRFNVASFGVLGYELDATHLTNWEKKVIKKQIAYYKEHRNILQFGEMHRFQNPFKENETSLMLVSKDKKEAILQIFQTLAKPNDGLEKYRIDGLDSRLTYEITARTQYFNLGQFGDLIKYALPFRLDSNGIAFLILKNHYLMKAEPEHQFVKGDQLMSNGFVPKQRFTGSGFNESVRLMGDFGSRLYHFKAKEDLSA